MEFNDVRLQYEQLRSEIDSAVMQVLAGGRYILGPVAQALEEDFARYCGASRGIAVASGTDALRIGLAALGVRAGDEVLVPAVSAPATAMAVAQLHATPVFVDVRSDDFTMDPEDAFRKIGSRTKAVVPVHLYGMPAHLKKLSELGVPLLEDAAQAHGSDAAWGSIVYRAKFLQALQQMIADGDIKSTDEMADKQLINSLYHKEWVVYAKAPFGGPHAVIENLGRYTLKVAISNHRIRSIDDEDGKVTFDYKDYSDAGTKKQMTLTAREFIYRFEQHILPQRFTKIKTYGYLANRDRHNRINEVLKKMKLPLHKGLVQIPLQVRLPEQFVIDMTECPCCKSKALQIVKYFTPGNMVMTDDKSDVRLLTGWEKGNVN